MFNARKLSCLTMIVVLLGLCIVSFGQVVEKKPPIITVPAIRQCPVCPRGTQPNALIQIDFTGLTASTYTMLPGPNNPAVMTPPPSACGTYYITNDPHACNGHWITQSQLPPSHGNILVCDGFSDNETKLFGKEVNGLVPGRIYCFRAWFKNLYLSGQSNCDPRVQLKITPTTGPSQQSGVLTLEKNTDWQSLSLPWSCPTGCTQATLEIWLLKTISPCGIGNDIGVDDISFVECKPIQMCDCRCERMVEINYWTPGGPLKGRVECGGSFNMGDVCLCHNISLTGKCTCAPDGCKPTYTWEITGPNTYHLSGNSATTPCNISFIPTQPGNYSIGITPKCGDKICPQCKINVVVRGIVQCRNSSQELPPNTEADKVQ